MTPSALAVFGRALRRSGTGAPVRLRLVDAHGATVRATDPAAWSGGLQPGDETLVGRCHGPTLDVGCGPGRLTAAVTAAGRTALGVDISAEAVRLARRRGADALRRSIFSPVPGTGRWGHVLLADGNIGIGGDPTRLLARCRDLLGPGGDVLVELDPPRSGSWTREVRLCDGDHRSQPFAWAAVGVDRIDAVAPAGLRTVEVWEAASRWFARLRR